MALYYSLIITVSHGLILQLDYHCLTWPYITAGLSLSHMALYHSLIITVSHGLILQLDYHCLTWPYITV